MDIKEMQIQVEDREGYEWGRVCSLLDALGWNHYPTYVTGEEIDAGVDNDESKDETIEVPVNMLEVYELLDQCGVFDDA